MEKNISALNQQNKTNISARSAELWDINQLAGYLGVCLRTARSLVERGVIPVIKVGRKIQRFRKESVDEALAKLELKPRYEPISRGGKR